jgi:hypothetical protein
MTRSALRHAAGIALALALALGDAAHAAAATRPIAVSYVSSGAVYLDAGRAEGLAPGARLKLVRGGETVAEIEVDFVAEHSASCKLVSSTRPVWSGDRAVLVSSPGAAEGDAPATPMPGAPEPEVASEPYRYSPAPRGGALPWAKRSGSLAVGYRTFSITDGPSSTESSGRLSLRLREIAGKPLELRVRLRGRRTEREGYGRSVATRQSSDRLYELSLAYDPPEGRFSFRAGRLAAGPFGGLGYLDGVLAQFRIGRRFFLGAFGGARPDLTELGFDTAGSKYGAFVRFATERDARPAFAEIVLGGVSERARGGDVSRDYLTVESRFGSGNRWWLFERAEIDLNRGWRREVAGKGSEVSNAALSASLRLTPSWRASFSYDQRRNYLTWETRPLPEEVFTRYFREGARLALEWQSRRGWNASLAAGQERADEIDEPTDAATFTLLKTGVFGSPLMLGGDGSFYSGGSAEGWVASLRARWVFRGGHDLGLTLGASEATFPDLVGVEARANEWVRLSGTVQLPFRLYLYGEYELATGDDFEGDRAMLELAYRF